jgi:hypothetical protein
MSFTLFYFSSDCIVKVIVLSFFAFLVFVFTFVAIEVATVLLIIASPPRPPSSWMITLFLFGLSDSGRSLAFFTLSGIASRTVSLK